MGTFASDAKLPRCGLLRIERKKGSRVEPVRGAVLLTEQMPSTPNTSVSRMRGFQNSMLVSSPSATVTYSNHYLVDAAYCFDDSEAV
jgi:hypothetical protein